MHLPVLGDQPSERADAARNRRRILEAAETLFAERGVAATSMDAIAARAGVGKGTLFRRFGDRAGLAFAVLDEGERALQERVLRGAPPLGPGAPPAERLVAFGEAMLDRLERNWEILVATEASSGRLSSRPYAAQWLHLRVLLEQAQPERDSSYAADILLGALGAQLFSFQRTTRGRSLEQLKAAFGDLARSLTN